MPINSFLYPGAKSPAPGYTVDNSCRFNDNDSSCLTRTQGTATNTKKCTFSAWVKRGNNTDVRLFSAESGSFGTQFWIQLQGAGPVYMANYESSSYSMQLVSSAKFLDPSAWYHFCIAIDTTQGTASNRVKLYVNGVQETSFSTSTFPAEDLVPNINDASINLAIGKRDAEEFMDGYLAEVAFIDGSALAPTSFGEFDDDSPTIWKPKDFKDDVTFGNNGYYLDFADSGDLGDDESGNGNDWTEVNLAAADQATDTPTNNFCTLNPIDPSALSNTANTFSEGNCKITDGSNYYLLAQSTFAVTAGKWYWETFIDATTSNTVSGPGIADVDGFDRKDGAANGAYGWIYAPDGDKRNAGTSSSYGDTYAANDVIGIALDMDNKAIYFSKNGTWQASGDPTSGASKTNAAYTNLTGTVAAHVYDGAGSEAHEFSLNFGGCPAFSISSGNADGNGYGNFEYAPPSGYLSLCTKNLGSDGG